jgi:peptide/nickel transport system substrate-binding protein
VQSILWRREAMKKGWRALALSLILVLPCVAVSCNLAGVTSLPDRAAPQATNSISLSEGKLVYGLTLSPSGIDPHTNASSELGIALSSVYDTLVYRAPATGTATDNQFVPGLAESWEVSDDGLTYTFHLRHDVTFQDGTSFNAEAVRVNIERILDPNLQSQKAVYLLGPVESAEVIGEYTVALHLSAPYAPLLDGLAQVYLGMASPAALTKWGADYQFHQVGTGPFKFVEYVPNDHLTLVRNDDYNWGPSIYDHSGPAYLKEIEFRFFTDPAGRALALEAGDVQVMGELPPLDAIRLRDDPRFNIIPVAVPGQPLGFMLNTQQPPLDDVRVRRALIFATDRDAMVQAIFGGQSPAAVGPLTASTFGYDPSLAGLYQYSPDKAAALLQEAGWVDSDGDGIRDRDGQPLVLKAALMTWGSVPEVAQLLQAQWAQVGVSLQTEVLTYPAALQVAREGTYHIMPQTYSGSDPDLLWTYYHSGEPFNWSKVSDIGLDGLLDQARGTSDPAQRIQLYQQAQQSIMEQALLIPIRDPVNLNAASARVQDLRFDAHGWFPLLHDVYLSPSPRD